MKYLISSIAICFVFLATVTHQKKEDYVDPMDYQIDITNDSTYIYDDGRLVGVLPYDSCSALDKLLTLDNQ